MIHRKRTTYGTHSDVSITTVVPVNFATVHKLLWQLITNVGLN